MEKLLEAYHRGTQALRDGDYAAALDAFVWAHDNPSLGDPSTEAVRRGYCFTTWAGLGNVYKPAREKMEELLLEKLKLSSTDSENKHLAADIRAMKQALIFADSISGE